MTTTLDSALNSQATPSLPRKRLPVPADPQFDEFWAAYPRKVGKVGAHRAWDRIIRRGATPREIIAACPDASAMTAVAAGSTRSSSRTRRAGSATSATAMRKRHRKWWPLSRSEQPIQPEALMTSGSLR